MTFWTIAANDFKLTVRDKWFFFWLLIFPLLFAVIFGMAFRDSSQDPKVTLNVLDKDGSTLSQALLKELQGEKYTVTLLDDETQKEYRTLIIPEHFTQDVLAGKKAELVLEKEDDANLEASQAAYSRVLKAVIKTLTRVVMISPQDQEDLDARLLQQEFERLITLKVEMAGQFKVIPSGFNHAVPGITVMFIIFTILMYGGINLLQERRQGQLERTYLSPATFSSIIGGKWLSRILLGMLQVILLFGAGRILFKVHLGNSYISLFLISLFFCATIAGMSILLGSIIKKEEILVIINIFLANLMASLGGCWWPLELVPRGVRNLGFIFPTGWAMDAFHKVISFGHSFESILPHIGALMLFTVIFLLIAIKFFRLQKN